jgi:hypothetical protein
MTKRPGEPEDDDAQRAKESPGLSNRGSKWVTRVIWRENELTPRRLDTYPKAQIRQGADRVSAPTRQGWGRRAGARHDAHGGTGRVMTN